jgi:hypothetical protein
MNNYANMMNNFPDNFEQFQNAQKPKTELKEKLDTQAGDNMNFNKCDFNGEANPNQVYDVYNGFIRGNMFPDLFNEYKLTRPYDIKPMNEQAEMLTKVDAYSFALNDINLYLDTHPNDQKMINLFKQYSEDVKTVTREYESKYGPLYASSSEGYPWDWNNMPWPWDN